MEGEADLGTSRSRQWINDKGVSECRLTPSSVAFLTSMISDFWIFFCEVAPNTFCVKDTSLTPITTV